MTGKIIAYTNEVAAELATRCQGDPERELRLWLRIAQVREAMVAHLYGLSAIDRRFGPTAERTVADVARKAIRNVWVHEESHTRYLRALQQAWDVEDVILNELFGRLQGAVTDAAGRGNLIARLAIAVGVMLKQAPEFATEVDRMNLREFCAFVGELEETAAHGYHRMLALASALPEGRATGLPFSLRMDVSRICAEELFHAQVFRLIDGWLAADGAAFRAVSPEACVHALHETVDRTLSMGAAAVRDPTHVATEHRDSGVWQSDGGMAGLFQEYGLPIRVA